MAKSKRTSRTDGGVKSSAANSWLARRSDLQLDLLCVGLLYLLTLILFRGIVFDDALFAIDGDTATSEAYRHAGDHIKKTEGIDPLWNPYVFSGMPSFGNVAYIPHSVSYAQTLMFTVVNALYLNPAISRMVVPFIIGGVFMFLLMRVWRMPRAPALLAAITFMLSPFAVGLVEDGHDTKLAALNFLPMVFLLTYVLFKRRDLLSLGLFATGIGTLLLTYHVQMAYYVFLVIGMYLIYHLINEPSARSILGVKTTVLFAAGLLIGFLLSTYVYLSVNEYTAYSIRGGGAAGIPGGLDWDYATNWSFYPFEMINYLIPSFFGFSSRNITMWQGQMTALPLYWGPMPFTTSTVYMGILPILFAILALVYKRNSLTLFAAGLSVLFLLMSFGKHFPLFFELLFNYLPFFNKFRAPSMILLLMPFTVGITAAYGMNALMEALQGKSDINLEKLRKALLYVVGGLWVALLLGTMFRSGLYDFMAGFMFVKPGENYAPQVLSELKKLRFDVLWSDYLKFVIIFSLSVGVIVLAMRKKMTLMTFSTLILTILVIDIFIIDMKYVNPKSQRERDERRRPDATVQYLKQQQGPFRIFPVGEYFGENSFMYHDLQTIGGYHPAKLKIYQTMIDSCLYKGADPEFPINMNMVNMLNARYVIAAGQLPPDKFQLVNTDQGRRMFTHVNSGALPRAFFVGKVHVAESDGEVFRLMNSADFNPAHAAIVEEPLPTEIRWPENASVSVKELTTHRITIQATNSAPALLVLSEIYYPAGWNAYVNGERTEIFKTNYILRSVIVPPGDNTIEFRFEPETYDLGWNISHAAWGVVVLLLLIGLWQAPDVRERLVRRKSDPKNVVA